MFIKLYTELKVQYTEQYTLLGVSKSFTAGLVEDFFFKTQVCLGGVTMQTSVSLNSLPTVLTEGTLYYPCLSLYIPPVITRLHLRITLLL